MIGRWIALAALLAGLAGCAGTLPVLERQPSMTVRAAADAPLAAVAAEAGVPAAKSGFWPLPQAAYSLDARLALIRHARTSLDLQYYLIGNDTVGRLVLRELRDAAARGVHVRLLVDDLYTLGLDKLLLGLAATPGIEVRLFNPFVNGRSLALGRLGGFIGDFSRLNHRMHNKLFIADGVLAVAGGRNLADEYFLRSREANFLDMDMLIAGALVPQLSGLFDRYWNSDPVFPLQALARSTLDAEALRDHFDDDTSGPSDPLTMAPDEPDVYGQPALSRALAAHQVRFVVADAGTHADTPAKVSDPAGAEAADSVASRFYGFLAEAKSEVLLFSPYFIPGERGLQRMNALRRNGVTVRVVTNALGTSDEPLVNVSYQRYRNQLLGMGVQLYELSASRMTRDPLLKRTLGSSRGRLHAKMAFVDRSMVLIGSMNMDLRSAYTNTELGIGIRSPELARMVLEAYRVDNFAGVYEVKLKDDGSGVQWVGHDEHSEEVLVDEPDVSLWQRLKLWFLYLFVPEDLL